MTTSVIYARIPQLLKRDVDRFSAERGVTLTTAIGNLLARGLEAVANEQSVGRLEGEVAQLRAEKRVLSARLREAEVIAREALKREEAMTGAQRSLAERIKQPVGECPQCRTAVTGEDLLVTTRCRNGHSLAPLLGGSKPEYMFLVGAVGVLVGIALAGSSGG